jgi:hypothetical protein
MRWRHCLTEDSVHLKPEGGLEAKRSLKANWTKSIR